jgi:hypothetical protein
MEVIEGGRRSGRTKALVLGLEEGSIVIVHTVATVDYVRKMIYDLRGAYFARTCKVLYLTGASDARRQLAGVDRPIAIDHAFLDYGNVSTVGVVLEARDRADSRLRR